MVAPLTLAALLWTTALASPTPHRRGNGMVTIALNKNAPSFGGSAHARRWIDDRDSFESIHARTRLLDAGLLEEREVAALERDLDSRDAMLYDYRRDMGYSVNVTLGTPPQEFRLTVDTGSPDVVVYGKNCTECGSAQTPKFDYEASKSLTCSNVTPNPGLLTYGAGHATSHWVTDTLELGGQKADNFDFAYASDGTLSDFSTDDISGILGMAYQRNASKPLPLPQKWATSGAWDTKQFGLYLKRNGGNQADFLYTDRISGGSEDGGELALGGLNTEYFDGDVEWHDITQTGAMWWTIPINGFSVNGQDVPIRPNMDVLIDSATTFLSMPSDAAIAFYKAIPGSAHVNGSITQWTVPCNTSAVVGFKFGDGSGQSFEMHRGDLIRGHMPAPNEDQCLGIVKAQGGFLFGAAFMKNVYTAHKYDPPQLGFAKLKPEYNVNRDGYGGAGAP